MNGVENGTELGPQLLTPLFSLTSASPTSSISPITLDKSWSDLMKIVTILVVAGLGAILNIFFVASFFVEKSLVRAGNVYLACTGLADLAVPLVVMPTAAVLLLARDWDTVGVCHFLHFLTVWSTYCYSFFTFLSAVESYFRHCCTMNQYRAFMRMRVDVVSVLVACASAVLAYLDVYASLNNDYCERLHHGHHTYRVWSITVLHIVPYCIGLCALLSVIRAIRNRGRMRNEYKRSQQNIQDVSFNVANIVAHMVYALFWSPYLIISFKYAEASDSAYYYAAWAGVSRAAIAGLVYCLTDKCFKRAYSHMFLYFCWRNSLSGSLAGRQQRAPSSPPGEHVAMHILTKALNTASPQRAAASSRDLHSSRCSDPTN